MSGGPSLPPHLEQFVREQVAAGRFPSEGDVIRAAIDLLATSPTGSPEGATAGRSRRPGSAATLERWEVVGTGTAAPPARRSPRGLLADLRSGLSLDDLTDARTELWTGDHPGGPR